MTTPQGPSTETSTTTPLQNQSSAENAAFYDAKPWLKSYAPGVKHELSELPYSNISEMVTKSAERFKSRTAFTICLPNGFSASLTFTEIETLATHFATYLTAELGLVKGDRVAVQMPNCLAYPIVAFGILRAGCVLVNVNPLYTEEEMKHQFNDSGAKALVIIDLFGNKLTNVIPKTQIRHIITASLADFFPLPLRAIIKLKLKLSKQVPPLHVHALPLMAALASGASRKSNTQPWAKSSWSEATPSAVSEYEKNSAQTWGPSSKQAQESSSRNGWITLDDVACLQYTGGTTGVSKGAMLTHRNLLSNVFQFHAFGSKSIEVGTETILTALPLYHVFAFTVNLLSFFSIGATNILVPSPRPISNLKKVFEKYPPTWLTGVNTLFNAMLNEKWFTDNPPKKLKSSIAGGMSLQSAVADKWVRIVGSPVVEGFGLTETSPILNFNPIGGGVVKKDTVGVPVQNTDMRIVDDNGNVLPPGVAGEIIARGPQVMPGYWNRPEETKKTFLNGDLKEGWFCTGDIGICDQDGYFRIVDRKKDMILVSGFNVYPNEVEDCIALHADVLEVAVIGIPDGASGESVKAYVVPRNPGLTAEVLREHCKKHLTGYKVPRAVEFRTELPKTPIGKILRKELRAEFLKQQGNKV